MKENEKKFREQDSITERIKDLWNEDEEIDSTELIESENLQSTYSQYELEEKIDQGGVKEISQMRDQKTGRSIAMATLRTEFQNPEHTNRFLREARMLASLEHPNIVPLYDIGYYDNDLPFFTMKLLSGDTLANTLKKIRGSNSEETKLEYLLDIFNKVCDAIAYAHSKSIVHLDLKPENIQINEFGEVLVLDWGFARHISDDDDAIESITDIDSLYSPVMTDITRVGAVNGTPGYMSPEQIKGERKELDQAADIYALGAILYNIITLDRPFKGETVEMILDKTAKGAIPEVTERLRKKVPGALIAVTEKAMAPSKKDRYQSVKEFQNEISAYMHGYATRAENADLFTLVSLLYKRNKKTAITLSIFIIIISALLYAAVDVVQETKTKGIIEKEIAVKEQKKESIQSILKASELKYKDLRDEFKFKEMLKQTIAIRDDGYDHPELWFREAVLQFGERNFDRAFFCLEKIEAYPDEMIKPYQKFLDRFEEVKSYDPNNELDMLKFSTRSAYGYIKPHLLYNFNNDPKYNLEQKIKNLARNLHYYNSHIPADEIKIDYIIEGDRIKKLDLSSNPNIDDIHPLIGLPVDELDISNLDIDTLHYLNDYFDQEVSVINVSNTKINFHKAYLDNTNFKSITARNIIFTSYNFTHAQQVEHLDLEGSAAYLRNFKYPPLNLKYLNIANTRISEISGLKRLPNLKTLVIDKEYKDNPTVKDLSKLNTQIKFK